jgi:hypothetical protein
MFKSTRTEQKIKSLPCVVQVQDCSRKSCQPYSNVYKWTHACVYIMQSQAIWSNIFLIVNINLTNLKNTENLDPFFLLYSKWKKKRLKFYIQHCSASFRSKLSILGIFMSAPFLSYCFLLLPLVMSLVLSLAGLNVCHNAITASRRQTNQQSALSLPRVGKTSGNASWNNIPHYKDHPSKDQLFVSVTWGKDQTSLIFTWLRRCGYRTSMHPSPPARLLLRKSFSKAAFALWELSREMDVYETQRQWNENKSMPQWSGRVFISYSVKCVLWPMAKGLRYLNWWIPQEMSSNIFIMNLEREKKYCS